MSDENQETRASNAASMREALLNIQEYAAAMDIDDGNVLAILDACRDALSAPARNCDRPECATSKTAQDVWRKEDGGKAPYYEWLLASAAERKGEDDDGK